MAEGNTLTDQEYIHNPNEFIDIHCRDKNASHVVLEKSKVISETLNSISDESTKIKETDNITDKETPFKSPIQVSEEKKDVNDHTSEDESEEYISAEDDDDDFIPVNSATVNENKNEEIGARGLDNNSEHSLTDTEKEETRESSTCDEDEIEENKDDIRRKMEEMLTDEEKLDRKEKSQKLKDDGNVSFRAADFESAVNFYTEGLEMCPLSFQKERSIMFANRAACKMKQESLEEAIADSTKALELHPHYLKALLRRAELYEKTDKLDEALKDFQQVVEIDPDNYQARAACVKLAEQIKDRNEKMKEEMMGKLKDLGDMVLRPFGLSVNNFKLQQDPATGSYSVNFQQNPSKNGS